jgi:hypothetical protein
MLKRTLIMVDNADRCIGYDCRRIPAGAIVKVVNPLILNIGGKPQIKVLYKGKSYFIQASESDIAIVKKQTVK